MKSITGDENLKQEIRVFQNVLLNNGNIFRWIVGVWIVLMKGCTKFTVHFALNIKFDLNIWQSV